MMPTQNPERDRVTSRLSPDAALRPTTPALLDSAPGAFPFIGTPEQRLASLDRRIEAARRNHAAVRHLTRRRVLLVARVAALGGAGKALEDKNDS